MTTATPTTLQRQKALTEQLDKLQGQHAKLTGQRDQIEAAWSDALAAGQDTTPHTSARRGLVGELEDLDHEIGRVKAWLGEVNATLEREQLHAQHEQEAGRLAKLREAREQRERDYAEAVAAAVATVLDLCAELVAGRADLGRLHEEESRVAAQVAQLNAAITGTWTAAQVQPAAEAARAALPARPGHPHFPRIVSAAERGPQLVARELGTAAETEMVLGLAGRR